MIHENRKIYQKLKPEYPYDIEPPQRKIGEVRSSETSINNYLPYIRDCSIEEIIAILNDPDIIKSKVTTDFDKLHLRWAINSDFQNNRDKYSEVNVVRILKEVRNNYTKMWFINNISDLNQNKEGLEYQGVIDILLDQEVNDEYYLMSIISLIDGLFNQGKDLSDYFKRIEEFILSNITSIKDDEKLDELDLGINSIFGRGLRIIIEINLDISNRNFDRFITNFESYQVFFDKLNALYFLG